MGVTAIQEVTIKIDDTFTGPVCDYGVGFLKFSRAGNQEVAEPMGTGTLVKHGRLYGILTGGHVLAKFGGNEMVGLVRFPSIQPTLQNRRLNLGLHQEGERLERQRMRRTRHRFCFHP